MNAKNSSNDPQKKRKVSASQSKKSEDKTPQQTKIEKIQAFKPTEKGEILPITEKKTSIKPRMITPLQTMDTTHLPKKSGGKTTPSNTTMPGSGQQTLTKATKKEPHTKILPTVAKTVKPIKPKYFYNNDLSDSYNKTFLKIVVKDPSWLFVWWEISPKTMNMIKQKRGSSFIEQTQWYLRLVDVTDTIIDGSKGGSNHDTFIQLNAKNWYLRIPTPEKTYLVQLGFFDKNKNFIVLIQSQRVTMPAQSISDASDNQWVLPTTDELIYYSAVPSAIKGGSSEQLHAPLENIPMHKALWESIGHIGASEQVSSFSFAKTW